MREQNVARGVATAAVKCQFIGASQNDKSAMQSNAGNEERAKRCGSVAEKRGFARREGLRRGSLRRREWSGGFGRGGALGGEDRGTEK